MNGHIHTGKTTVRARRTSAFRTCAGKRTCKTRGYACITVILAALMIVTISVYGILIVNASNNDNKEKLNRYYTSITVKADDTLWNIAQKYASSDESRQSYINNIKVLNNMTDDTIYSGHDILIYYYSEDIKK